MADHVITTAMNALAPSRWVAAGEATATTPACGPGSDREYLWARVPIRVFWRPARGPWLLTRRNISTGELAYRVCYEPRKTRLMDLARIAGSRRAVEECFQQAKNQVGLDEYRVRDRRAWYDITLSMAAHAWLVVARNLALKGEPAPAST
ncbi:hypothetical protein [Actinoplanes sp. NPDC051494]|uniref:hypothetical protein n=1 Tax=Actinoplanes sp. NPDC051494 TaxID=3363907 RepID=UPI0037AF4F76